MLTKRATFKKTVIALLEEHLLAKEPLPISWHCVHCDGHHSGDLLRRVKSVTEDTSTEIFLLDENANPFAVIDISKNKKFNSTAAEGFQQSGVIYIQLNPLNDNGRGFKDMLAGPKYVNSCLNPKCKKCNGFQKDKSLVIIDADCWKCKAPMKVGMLDCGGYHPGPEAFTDDELALAREEGVDIRDNFSRTIGESYLSNTCPHCDALTGQHYLFTDYFVPANNGEYPYETFHTGYFCERCHWEHSD
ncbi:hypothetical protein [Daejeonella sp.]|uniref:hypothetical protein n=1 Tax=Daejeonella sp. TaxID=2805397 RepID=UPI0030BAB0EC